MSESPSSRPNLEGIAIIGMSGRFPGAANVEEFWKNLVSGTGTISQFTKTELEHSVATPEALAQGKRFVRARGVLENADKFDAAFFGISPREAELMDPQHRLFLECAWEALESAGHDPDTFPGMIGVYAGLSLNTYLIYNLCADRRFNANFAGNFQVGEYQTMIGNDKDFLPTRVSFRLNLRGPSMAIQCACSTSLVAVSQACASLLSYQSDMALAGGVSISFPQKRDYLYTEDAMVSPDGTCRAFDADARGTIFGHGAGVVLLKRLADAVADGDTVLAVITGSAVNNDGAGKISYAAPGVRGQADVIGFAQAAAGVHPDSISYIEAHGTGTPLGDPIEVAALTQAFRTGGAHGNGYCAIGSGKTHIGHLDAAAGVTGLIKTVLQLQHGLIPPLLHFKKPNPQIDFANSPFFPVTKPIEWKQGINGGPRRAGVSAFGVGGTNAHAIVEEAPPAAPSGPSRPWQLLLLSAKTATALDQATANLAAHLAAHPEISLSDVAFTLKKGRRAFPHRRTVVAAHPADAIARLQSRDPKIIATGQTTSREPTVVFLFPGQGTQSVGMGRELYEQEPVFRAEVDRCALFLAPLLGLDLRTILYPPEANRTEAETLINETRVTQPAIFTIEYALAQLWLSWGVKPVAVIGHSIGEYVAAVLAKALTLDDALTLLAARAKLIQAQPSGAMLAVRLGATEVEPLLPAGLSIAAHNSPKICTVSGPPDAIALLAAALEDKKIAVKPLTTSHAFHSAMMEPVVAPFTALVEKTPRHAPQLRWISTCTGREMTAADMADAGYWSRQLRQAVLFTEALTEVAATPNTVLLEVGPGQSLTQFARQLTTKAADATVVPTWDGGKPELESMLTALGRLWLTGVSIDWNNFYATESRRRVALPTYPFERKRHWVEPAKFSDHGPVSSTVASASEEIAAAVAPASTTPPPKDHVGITAELRTILFQLSGIEIPDERASFLELGFDSLLLTQVSQAIRSRFGVKISFRLLLDSLGTLEKAGAHIAEQLATASTSSLMQSGAPWDLRVADAPVNVVVRIPVTDEQREIWLGARHSPDASKAFNDVVVLRLRGSLDRTRMHENLRSLVNRHDALRTTFSPDGDFQHIAPDGGIELPVTDLTELAPDEREAQLQQIAVLEDSAPFNLETGPLFRVRLLILNSTEYVLLFSYHHIVVDGWSSGVLLRELGQLHGCRVDGAIAPLAPAMQFREYAAWQTSPEQINACAKAEKYWLNRFTQLPSPADLPGDRPHPAAKTFRSAKSTALLDPQLCRRIRESCGQLNCTPFHFLFAVYTAWLHRLTGSSDLVIGVPVAGQISEALRDRRGSRNLVGHCVHFLPVRIAPAADKSFTSHLDEARRQLLDARDHEFFTYGNLVKKLRLPRDPSRMPLLGVMFNFLPLAEEIFSMENLKAHAVFQPKAYNIFDLNVYVATVGDGLQINCEYNTALFDPATIERWQHQWRGLIETVLTNPRCPLERLPILTETERQCLLQEWNHTVTEYPRDRCIHQLFEAQAARHSDKVALSFGQRTLTYRELNERADQLAQHLTQTGAAPDVLIGICLDRSPELVIAVLGVLKAGAAYVPIDPTYPADRIAFMLEDAAVKILVTQKNPSVSLPATSAAMVFMDELPAAGTKTDRAQATAQNLAYVRYTSGSTGNPKGVQIEHRAIVNFIESMRRTPGLTADDVLLAVTTLSFDISELEIHLPLTTGAQIVIVPWETVADGQALLETVKKYGVTVMQATPATWRLMLDAGWQGTAGLKVLCGGEALPADLARQLIPRCAELWNMYGPTETTVWSTCQHITDASDTSIGRPIANTDTYILDAQLQPMPIGVAGELMIGGDGMARGYLNRPELTAEKFIPHPFKPGARLYRTGDLARYSSAGRIECLGRLDFQIKIRGFRIELGEIEAVLSSHSAVRQAVVIAREDLPGDKRLVAYYTTRPGVTVSAGDLRDHIRGKIPHYMLPSVFVPLESIPLTPNGKVDRKALPAPQQENTVLTSNHEPPATEIEQQLAAIWSRILKVTPVGRNDNFFELGGNSLLAVTVFSAIEKTFGRHLPLAMLFNAPTIAGLAGNLGLVEPGTDNWPSIVPIQPKGTKPRFFCVHGAGGNVLLYRDLAARLGNDYPFYGLQSRGLDGKSTPLTTVAEMATAYLEEIRRFQPQGPYHLGGYCLGGTIALEIAGLLRQQGEEVALLALLDTYNFTKAVQIGWLYDQLERLKFHLGSFSRLRPGQMMSYVKEKFRVAMDGELAAIFQSDKRGRQISDQAKSEGHVALQNIQSINDYAVGIYRPKSYPGKMTLFKPIKNYAAFPDPLMGWDGIAMDGLEVVELPMNPHAMLVEPFVQQLAEALAVRITPPEKPSTDPDPCAHLTRIPASS